MLSKVKISKSFPDVDICNDIKKVLKYDFIENSIYYSNNDGLIINNKSKHSYKIIDNKVITFNKILRIPIQINNIFIWKSIDVFDQNNILIANKIRKYVCNQLNLSTSKYLLGIGGEFVTYFVLLQYQYNFFYGLSNNKHIVDNSIFNSKLYHLKYNIKQINYNNMISKLEEYCDVIINLSKINLSIINYLNNESNIQKLIIIGCNNKDLAKKLNLLKKYKIKDFKYFKNFNNCVKVYYLIPK